MSKKPLLSIGMIFKNEIRCLERCMKSLAPLREAIPCELVVADTGSTDGSREIAEKYADILFDFPWIDDFAAARNAVMDKCSGTWYFSIDADEWLDEDIGELLYFLKNKKAWTGDVASLMVRNYTTTDLGPNSVYVDMLGIRFVLMSTRARYVGAIHEIWEYPNGRREACVAMRRLVLHHDGYVGLNTTVGGALKRHRNLVLLKKELERKPDDLRTWMQCLESTGPEPDHLDYVRKAVEKVQAKVPKWEMYGAPIIRYAVEDALLQKLPEADAWIRMAEEWFPDSFFITLDMGYLVCRQCWLDNKYEECIHRGEQWLKDYARYSAGEGDQSDLLVNSLQRSSPRWKTHIKLYIANACLFSKSGNIDQVVELLRELDGTAMDEEQVVNTVRAMTELHAVSDLNTAPLIKKFYKQLATPKPDEKAAGERKEAFKKEALSFFRLSYLQTETHRTDSKRRAATLFAPLNGDIGTAASILETEDAQKLEKLLDMVEDWAAFPVPALAHALKQKVVFPRPGKCLDSEIMDTLAIHLSNDKERFFSLVRQATEEPFTQNVQTLAWAKSLILAALQVNDWTEKEEPEKSVTLFLDIAPSWSSKERGMALTRAFAAVEREFLPRCYAPNALEENRFLLPPMHRFGWHVIQAIDALDAGDRVNCVRSLRAGLSACPGMKPMVEALLKHIEDNPPESPELLALAEQVRTLLAAYPPDDPAVAVLKASPAYQEVAHLIEGPELGIYGGLTQ